MRILFLHTHTHRRFAPLFLQEEAQNSKKMIELQLQPPTGVVACGGYNCKNHYKLMDGLNPAVYKAFKLAIVLLVDSAYPQALN